MVQGVELGLSKAVVLIKESVRRRESRAGGWSTQEHQCWHSLPSVGQFLHLYGGVNHNDKPTP